MNSATDDNCALLADVDNFICNCQHRYLQATKRSGQCGHRIVQASACLDCLLEERVRIRYALRDISEFLPVLELKVERQAVELLFPLHSCGVLPSQIFLSRRKRPVSNYGIKISHAAYITLMLAGVRSRSICL